MKTTNNYSTIVENPISAKVISNYAMLAGITAPDANCRARELEKFLFLCARFKHPLVPSPAIDSIWHDFILHTREYQKFCSQNFGCFIHHTPSRDASQNLKEGYIATIEALRNQFGDVDPVLWPHSEEYLNNQVCGGDGDCKGGCDGDS